MDPAELERLVDRALKRLPAPRAPRTLLPRVMLAVQASRPAPAPATNWRTWPLAWQAASVAALILLVMGAVNVWPLVHAIVSGLLAEPASGPSTRVAEIAQGLGAIAAAGRVIWRVALQPVAVFGLMLVVIMFGACAVFGTALGKVALGGASRI